MNSERGEVISLFDLLASQTLLVSIHTNQLELSPFVCQYLETRLPFRGFLSSVFCRARSAETVSMRIMGKKCYNRHFFFPSKCQAPQFLFSFPTLFFKGKIKSTQTSVFFSHELISLDSLTSILSLSFFLRERKKKEVYKLILH